MITTPHKLGTPAAELSPKEFEAEYERLARRVEQAEKMPGRKMTQAEVALWQKDWKAFSKLRGYTADEIAEYERWLDMHGGFTAETLKWSTPAELHRAIVAAAVKRSEPVSAKAARDYKIPLPDGYAPAKKQNLLIRVSSKSLRQ